MPTVLAEADVVRPEVLAALMSWTEADFNEWVGCQSPRRYFVALNETMDPHDLEELVYEWFDEVDADDLLEQCVDLIEDTELLYELWVYVVKALGEDGGDAWISYVRAHLPPVEGFQWIGRDANESRRYVAGDAHVFQMLWGE